jgi:hypothetical protein
MQPKNLGNILGIIESFYVFQQSAEYSVWSKGSVWMYVLLYGIFNDAESTSDFVASNGR